ncbi:hypothetical protein [uncultured Sphingomonas sp.]|uniref:hypothetical protein n=1 Tax=uncultured Sphingomonas sp. TaxID=158754 RepID=UPI0035CB95C7
MKISICAAGVAAVFVSFISAPSAFAADSMPTTSTGHYEWRAQPSYGPRTPARAPVRVWVSDGKAMAAGCDYGMMRGSEAQAAGMAMPINGRPASQG